MIVLGHGEVNRDNVLHLRSINTSGQRQGKINEFLARLSLVEWNFTAVVLFNALGTEFAVFVA